MIIIKPNRQKICIFGFKESEFEKYEQKCQADSNSRSSVHWPMLLYMYNQIDL